MSWKTDTSEFLKKNMQDAVALVDTNRPLALERIREMSLFLRSGNYEAPVITKEYAAALVKLLGLEELDYGNMMESREDGSFALRPKFQA